jgi:DNA-binding PadR family transcriptional regulator
MRSHHEAFDTRGLRDLFDSGLRAHGFGGGSGQRVRREDVRLAILRLLTEEPMHGYQIIGELADRSDGAWTPSAGAVYPTLQLLAEEGLILPVVTGGKKVFSLTEAGQLVVDETAEQPAPWDEAAEQSPGGPGYHEAAGKLVRAVFQVGRSGSTEQVKQAVDVLNEARRKLYAILADD